MHPDPTASFAAENQVVAGNVIGYGATGGEIFLRGNIGERFCVRNSGALAVSKRVLDVIDESEQARLSEDETVTKITEAARV